MKTLKDSHYDWFGQYSLQTKTPLSRPLSKNTCACQPKAVSSNCTTKYLMQPKPLRAKYKGLLVSHFESYKSEEEEVTWLKSHP